MLTAAVLLASCSFFGPETVGDGFWEVGVDFRRPPSLSSGLPPDRYVFDWERTEEMPSCYWAARDRVGRTLALDEYEKSQRVRILVPHDTHELELRGCGNVNLGGLDGPDAVPYQAQEDGFANGVWRAGEDFRHPPAVGPPDRYVFDTYGYCRWKAISEDGDVLASDDFLSPEEGLELEVPRRMRNVMESLAFFSSLDEELWEALRRGRILMPRGTFELDLAGCGIVHSGGLEGPDAAYYVSRAGDLLGDGIWRVGVDLPAVAEGQLHRYVLDLPQREETYDCVWRTYGLAGWREEGDTRRVRPTEGRSNPREEILVSETAYELELTGCGGHDFTSPEVLPAA